ncbi:molybdopterin-guanine dinucleotide biosynthesis protein B [Desulfofalx alkaliphila]|uniref:molybdopterin-guanine dinucleotide biosynthesis protein B n=1 Tax=Desulfofalx alkaliphila TaxID=105483 RepID=UPI0004E1CE3F|nr:molybdopterin-guanine dinucleotide biosynthesis protein B [Desulfofalx alkaliphila]
MVNVPVISLVGWSNTGKTTFLEKLIAELKSRGYRVGTIKHWHGDVEIDQPGKDTYRHAKAGADGVVIAGSNKVGLIRQTTEVWSLQKLVQLLGDMDIIITEGFKKEDTPKIEMYRHGVTTGPVVPSEKVVAVVSDIKMDRDVPVFDWNDSQGVADFIEHRFMR